MLSLSCFNRVPSLSLFQEDSVSESSSDAGLGSEPESETTTIGNKQIP